MLFALQEWVSLHSWYSRVLVTIALLLEAWGVQYFLLGLICWLLWWKLGEQIQRANLFSMVIFVLPLSVVLSVAEEMIWVALFPISVVPKSFILRRPNVSCGRLVGSQPGRM